MCCCDVNFDFTRDNRHGFLRPPDFNRLPGRLCGYWGEQRLDWLRGRTRTSQGKSLRHFPPTCCLPPLSVEYHQSVIIIFSCINEVSSKSTGMGQFFFKFNFHFRLFVDWFFFISGSQLCQCQMRKFSCLSGLIVSQLYQIFRDINLIILSDFQSKI